MKYIFLILFTLILIKSHAQTVATGHIVAEIVDYIPMPELIIKDYVKISKSKTNVSDVYKIKEDTFHCNIEITNVVILPKKTIYNITINYN